MTKECKHCKGLIPIDNYWCHLCKRWQTPDNLDCSSSNRIYLPDMVLFRYKQNNVIG